MMDRTPLIDTLRIGAMARRDGRPDYLDRVQEQLREQERNGDIRIIHMDDEEARVQFLNPAWARLFGGAQ